jgi:hypothetical protein
MESDFTKVLALKPRINTLAVDELYCREYVDYESFDKSKRRREDLVKTMIRGCKVLDDLGVTYCLGRGSVLGLHRDQGFLPTDVDIDIDVFGDEKVYQMLKQMPFDEFFITSNKGHYQQLALVDKETNVIFDIFFYYEKNGQLINRNYFGYFWLPGEIVRNLHRISFEGYDFSVPEMEWYCEFWYGEHWRQPKKYGQDWSIDYRKDCKGLIYTGEKDIVYQSLFKK